MLSPITFFVVPLRRGSEILMIFHTPPPDRIEPYLICDFLVRSPSFDIEGST